MYDLFDLQDAIVLGDHCKLTYVTQFKFERDWNGMRHSHKSAELFFCTNGQGKFFIRDTVLIVNPLDFIIIPPMVEHAEASTAFAPLEYIVLGISGTDVLFDNAAAGYYKGNFSRYSSLILPLLTSLVEELAEKPNGHTYICSNMVNILIMLIKRMSTFKFSYATPSDCPTNQNITWIKQYIDENFTSDISLELLANKIGLNKYGIIRGFKRIYGTSPIRYMIDRRFHEAEFLLQTTENTIQQISESLGFSSSNYFTQCFQKKEGITPTQYREQCRRKQS